MLSVDMPVADCKLVPGYVPYFRSGIPYVGVEKKFLREMMLSYWKRGAIKRSTSAHGAPLIVALKAKHFGERPDLQSYVDHPNLAKVFRAAGNYVQVNEGTTREPYPTVIAYDVARTITRPKKWKLDIDAAYMRFRMTQRASEAFAFTVHPSIVPELGDHFEWTGMPWGPTGSGDTCQRGMDNILREEPNLKGNHCDCVTDDFIFDSTDEDSGAVTLESLLSRLWAHKVPVSWDKCDFCADVIDFGGMVITPDGILPDPNKVQGIKDIGYPHSWDDVGRFQGMLIGHNKSVPNLAHLIKPFTVWLKNRQQGSKFVCTPELRTSWDKAKDAISSACLKAHDGPGDIDVYVDWAKPAISGHVTRTYRGKVHVLAYSSRALIESESNYLAPEGEFLAIWWLVTVAFERYTRGRHSTTHCDHRTLAGLRLKKLTGHWAGKLLDLFENGTTVVTIPGKLNVISDAIGRLRRKQGEPVRPIDLSINNPLDDNDILRLDDPADRFKLFCECHTGPVGGHFGLANTKKWMRSQADWDDFDKDVELWFNSCHECQINGRGKQRKAPLRHLIPNEPFEIWGFDFLGPYKWNGTTFYVFFGCDSFSATVVAGLMEPTTAGLIEAVETRIIWNYGTPKYMISDRDSRVMNVSWKKFCDDSGITHLPTVPNHQSANGLSERNTATFKKVLVAKLIAGIPIRLAVKMSVAAMNNVLHRAPTGLTSHEVVYGTKWIGPLRRRVIKRWESILEKKRLAESNRVVARQRADDQYNKKATIRKFTVGQWVLLWNQTTKKFGEDKRFGPFEIIVVLSHDNYLIFDSVHGRYKPVHVSQLDGPYNPALQALEMETHSQLERYLLRPDKPRNVSFDDLDFVPPSKLRSYADESSTGNLREILASVPRTPARSQTSTSDTPSKFTRSQVKSVPSMSNPLTNPRSSPKKSPLLPPKKLDFGTPPVSPIIRAPIRGERVEVFWNEKDATKVGALPGWYPGTVTAAYGNSKRGTHAVHYDDDKAAGRIARVENLVRTEKFGSPATWRPLDDAKI
jgi:hypothetical protein